MTSDKIQYDLDPFPCPQNPDVACVHEPITRRAQLQSLKSSSRFSATPNSASTRLTPQQATPPIFLPTSQPKSLRSESRKPTLSRLPLQSTSQCNCHPDSNLSQTPPLPQKKRTPLRLTEMGEYIADFDACRTKLTLDDLKGGSTHYLVAQPPVPPSLAQRHISMMCINIPAALPRRPGLPTALPSSVVGRSTHYST